MAAVFLLAASGTAAASVRTWDGGGGDTNWNTAANWTADTLPVTGDSVVFDGTSTKNCVMNVDIDLGNFSVNSGYTGTISKSGTRRLSLGYGGNGGGTFTQATGTFQAPSYFVVRKFSRSGGTFTHNSGNVIFSASADQSNTYNSAAFYNFVVNDGLIGYYKLDETGTLGTISDYSGFGFNLTAQNTPTASTNVASTMFYNSGSVAFVKNNLRVLNAGSLNSTYQRPSVWTLSAFARITSIDSSGGDEIISGGNRYMLRIITGAKVEAIMYDGSTYQKCDSSNSFTVNDSVFHHVVAVNDGTNLYAWLDGTKTTCSLAGATQSYSSLVNDFTVGSHADYTGTTGYETDGYIDEVRVYNRALTDGEILALYAGSQPGTSKATQTASDTFSVANDMIIGAGTLALGSNSITVSGNWYNWGGLFSSSGTVTMNSTTNQFIVGNRQHFNTLTFTTSGSGNWANQDSLYVDGTVNLQSGYFQTQGNDPRWKQHLGNFNQTGGTYDQNGLGGCNLISSSASNTLKVTSDHTLVSQFRFEAKGENDLVGYWKLDDLTGTNAEDVSGNSNDGTLTNGVRWWSSKYDNGTVTTSIGSPIGFFYDGGWVDLDGVDDYIALGTTSIPVPNASKTISLWVYYDATTAAQQNFFSLVDATAAHTIQLGFHSSNIAVWKSGGTDLVTYAIPAVSTWHHVVYTYDSSSGLNKLYVDGTLQSSSSTAVDAAGSAPYYATIGAYRGSSGTYMQFYDGRIDEVRVYDIALTAKQIKSMSQDKYPGLGSSVTWTLGAAMDIGSFSMDNGTLDTSSFAVTTTGNCYVPSGVLKIGSGTVTCGNDPVIYDVGTLKMNTAGGVLKVTGGKTIELDGTLEASTAGANPTIQSVSGTYTFSVGYGNANDSSTPTPTLNINGLQVKNTDVNGMYINANNASTVTVSRFDNVSFSSGDVTSGATLLKIYGTSFYMTGNSCTFDRTSMNSTSYNVAITGDGTANGETRATFGNTTCKGTAGAAETCESHDSDDDAGPDGVGDTPASNGAVVQFIYETYSDTAGSIVGYPTAAFNWSTFSWWKTYAAFNNIDGNGTNRLYARNENGSDAGYSWDIPAGKGTFVGAPRWDMESTTHYVYVVTSLGYVYKITDTGAALNTVTAQAWPYWNGGSSTATSPLAMDASNVYWSGNDSSGNPKMFSLARSSMTLNGSRTVTANATGAPAVYSIAGALYLFTAINAKVYRMPQALGSDINAAPSASNVTSPVGVYLGSLLFADAGGKFWVLNASDLTTTWSYTNANTSAIGGFYYDNRLQRAFYGDAVGKMYAIVRSGVTANGVVLSSNYPYQPTGVSSSDSITVSPVNVVGVTAYGTSTGKVIFVDAQNASNQPALIQLYHFGSAVSAIGYDYQSATVGNFMIGTADGHMYFIRRDTSDSTTMTDPTTSNL